MKDSKPIPSDPTTLLARHEHTHFIDQETGFPRVQVTRQEFTRFLDVRGCKWQSWNFPPATPGSQEAAGQALGLGSGTSSLCPSRAV